MLAWLFRSPRARLGALLASGVLTLSAAVSACSRTPVSPAAVKRTHTDSASQKLFGLHAPMTHNGVSRGILRADSAFVYQDGMRIELRGVRAALEGPTGLPLATLTSKDGVVTLTDSRVRFLGAVEVTSTAGRLLQTAQLTFDLKNNRLLGDSAYTVKAAKTAKAVVGAGFVADPALLRVQSEADFLKDEAAATLRAAKATKDSAARKAKAQPPSRVAR